MSAANRMGARGKAAKGLSALISGARARALLDILPPYRVADGVLERKEAGEDGGDFRIVINGARISVDAATFQRLQPGDRLKARYTARLKRAISITRYVGGKGGDSPDSQP